MLGQGINYVVPGPGQSQRQVLDRSCEELRVRAVREASIQFLEPLRLEVEREQDGFLIRLAMALEVRLPSVDHQGTLSRDRVLPAVDPELDVGSADLENNMAFPMRVEHHRVV